MKSEIEFTKAQYDQLTNENIQLRKELDQAKKDKDELDILMQEVDNYD